MDNPRTACNFQAKHNPISNLGGMPHRDRRTLLLKHSLEKGIEK